MLEPLRTFDERGRCERELQLRFELQLRWDGPTEHSLLHRFAQGRIDVQKKQASVDRLSRIRTAIGLRDAVEVVDRIGL
jgi:hypothetical protein